MPRRSHKLASICLAVIAVWSTVGCGLPGGHTDGFAVGGAKTISPGGTASVNVSMRLPDRSTDVVTYRVTPGSGLTATPVEGKLDNGATAMEVRVELAAAVDITPGKVPVRIELLDDGHVIGDFDFTIDVVSN